MLTLFIFLLQVKNKPYPVREEYAFILENAAVANIYSMCNGFQCMHALNELHMLGETLCAEHTMG
jgi:hypothetical protein